MMTTKNPLEWGLAQFGLLQRPMPAMVQGVPIRVRGGAPERLGRIGRQDLVDALRAGAADFAAARTDVLLLCLLYPVAGVLLFNGVVGYGIIHWLFPIAAGFALLGPFFAVGLNEMSRRRDMGMSIGWQDAFEVARSPGFGPVLLMGLILVAIYLAWLVAAALIYAATFGANPPGSMGSFLGDIFGTARGWALLLIGCGVGCVFAAVVLVIASVSFPMLLDRDVGVETAIATSIRAARENPAAMAQWGLIVAGLLLLGSLPAFLGLALVLPVLGHATWHLYRRIVPL